MDDDDQDDALDDGQDRGGEVVDDGAGADLVGEAEVQRANGRDDGGHEQRDDERLQHPEEQVPDELHVHDFALPPSLRLGGAQHEPQAHAPQDPHDGERRQEVVADAFGHALPCGPRRHPGGGYQLRTRAHLARLQRSPATNPKRTSLISSRIK